MGKLAVKVVATSRDTICVLIVNVPELCPPGMFTDEGKFTYAVPVAFGSATTLTFIPPAGAGEDSVIVAVVAFPPATMFGLITSEAKRGD